MASSTPSLRANIAFAYTMHLMKPDSLEAAVQDVWQTIVSQWFTSSGGYVWAIKVPILAKMPDDTVLRVTQGVQIPAGTFPLIEHPILLVVCKRASSDSSKAPLDWDDAMQSHFLHHISETPNSEMGRLFGAVAVGTRVRFYRFDGKAELDRRLARLHQDTFNLEEFNGHAQVEDIMNSIKTNAWQWVTS
ncbi:Cytochrome b5 [Penicillium vulpinum]|uniref:Uncharacterized protein n=1 Tax=Penicillium vulpinum TaxID=29845 RepID=A0A1V6S9F1_9EURO|nr:Cytochrome b5 [Penicillium vulpinum]KAJ5952159.1 Cytochrome b5 [Penicillium vulpinum]OQE10369.1 hypothetical protein PENVUL_c004G08867 [Penicillium vulpinum]